MSIVQPEQDSKRSEAQPTSVYRYYDAVGMLIYVGITHQGMGRNLQHNGKAEWWPFVARQEVEHHPDRPTAAKREKQLIRQFHPPFNKQHNPDSENLRASYYAFAASGPNQANPLDLYKRLGKRLPLDVMVLEPHALALRTRIEHAPLAEVLRLDSTYGVSVRGNRSFGRVTELRTSNLFSYIVCKTRSRMPDSIGSAMAELKWSAPKPSGAIVQLIRITHQPGEAAA
jgi:hypothetical protein